MALSPYARHYQTQSILTASPGQLVLMLYDGALRFLAQAQAGFELPASDLSRIEKINTNILRAEAILRELQSNLDMERGGELATNLNRLYDFHLEQLFRSNLRKDPAPLLETERLLRSLRDGWAEMLQKQLNPDMASVA